MYRPNLLMMTTLMLMLLYNNLVRKVSLGEVKLVLPSLGGRSFIAAAVVVVVTIIIPTYPFLFKSPGRVCTFSH
jgi:hypothetical protein